MINVQYINSKNVKIDFRGPNFVITDKNDLANWEWNYDVTNNVIKNMGRKIKSKSMQILITANSENECRRLKDTLLEVTEIDMCNQVPGKLYIGNYYIECYLVGKDIDNSVIGRNSIETLTIMPKSKAWMKEISKQFMYAGSEDIQQGHGYPYGYPYGYRIKKNDMLSNNHFAPCDFVMKISGYADNPLITIGNHPYKVNVTVANNEILEIDSQNKTIKLVKADGTTENVFSKRDKTNYIFEKIPTGKMDVSWNGEYSFEIKLFEERSEPKWG